MFEISIFLSFIVIFLILMFNLTWNTRFWCRTRRPPPSADHSLLRDCLCFITIATSSRVGGEQQYGATFQPKVRRIPFYGPRCGDLAQHAFTLVSMFHVFNNGI